MIKEIFGIIAIIITFVAFIPYIKSILQNKNKTTFIFLGLFSHLPTMVIAIAQIYNNGRWSNINYFIRNINLQLLA